MRFVLSIFCEVDHSCQRFLIFLVNSRSASNELIVWRLMLNVILDVEAITMATMEPLRVLSVQLVPEPALQRAEWVSLMWDSVSASIKLVVKCQTQPWAHENFQTRFWHPSYVAEKVFVSQSRGLIDHGGGKVKSFELFWALVYFASMSKINLYSIHKDKLSLKFLSAKQTDLKATRFCRVWI